jgi:hypothetical protein
MKIMDSRLLSVQLAYFNNNSNVKEDLIKAIQMDLPNNLSLTATLALSNSVNSNQLDSLLSQLLELSLNPDILAALLCNLAKSHAVPFTKFIQRNASLSSLILARSLPIIDSDCDLIVNFDHFYQIALLTTDLTHRVIHLYCRLAQSEKQECSLCAHKTLLLYLELHDKIIDHHDVIIFQTIQSTTLSANHFFNQLLSRLVFLWLSGKENLAYLQCAKHFLQSNNVTDNNLYFVGALIVFCLLSDITTDNTGLLIDILDLIWTRLETTADHLYRASVMLGRYPMVCIFLIIDHPMDTQYKVYRNFAFKLWEKHQIVQSDAPEKAKSQMITAIDAVLNISYRTSSKFVCFLREWKRSFQVGVSKQISNPIIWTVFNCSRAFYSGNECLWGLKILVDQAYMIRDHDWLKIFGFYMHLLKLNPNSQVSGYILSFSLPSMAKVKDPHVLAALTRLIISLAKHGKVATVTEIVAFKTLVKLKEMQPRSWKHLKNYIYSWSHLVMNGRTNYLVKSEVDNCLETELELAVTDAIVNLCKSDPMCCSADLIPISVKMWHLPKLSHQAAASLLDSIIVSIDAGIVFPEEGNTKVIQFGPFL